MPLATFSQPRWAGHPGPKRAAGTRRAMHGGPDQRHARRGGRTTQRKSHKAVDEPLSDPEDDPR
jgi:hypothetical protein